MKPEMKPEKDFSATELRAKKLSPKDLEVLEPIIDQLLTGSADAKYDVKDVALRLAALGYPNVLDCT